MKPEKHVQDRFRALLAEAYRTKVRVEIDEGWQDRVMASVRHIGPLPDRAESTGSFGLFAWRLAPFTLTMSVVLVFLLTGLYLTTTYDELLVTTRQVEEMALKQALGD